jgi:hypothetical protein
MVDDEAVNVRQQVLHTICDGSPTHLEFDVAEALDGFNYLCDQNCDEILFFLNRYEFSSTSSKYGSTFIC